jgi:NAD(P)H-dependent FMN reductase
MTSDTVDRVTEDRLKPRVLAFSGSIRTGSLNTMLLGLICKEIERQGALVTELSLSDYALPIYNGDIEERAEVPLNVATLRKQISDQELLLITCPEHNGSVTALLKNTLDWCSRPVDGLLPLAPFQRKPVLLASTSTGPFGGLRAIGHLRAILSKMGALVIPQDLVVPFGQTAFSAKGFASAAIQNVAGEAVSALLYERAK